MTITTASSLQMHLMTPANFSLTESNPDMEHIMPQFDELRFSDSKAEGEENDLLDDPLFQSHGMLFTGEDSRNDNEYKDDDLPAVFHEPSGSTHAAVQIHLEGIAIGLRVTEAQSPDVTPITVRDVEPWITIPYDHEMPEADEDSFD
ncbi:hypothetical protein PILCRDRAFT_11115 [Piloderma croceum F 1598]|uniref:Uncharacterized protein n=1 Tax=Piloderma croceum (strain F 1598) TaxID=765440 RepID=A0A0C3AXC7_PILCF|nr:hypothetical protein PILCRDRAFT_11115 [Piloderma croceum F 1598]